MHNKVQFTVMKNVTEAYYLLDRLFNSHAPSVFSNEDEQLKRVITFQSARDCLIH